MSRFRLSKQTSQAEGNEQRCEFSSTAETDSQVRVTNCRENPGNVQVTQSTVYRNVTRHYPNKARPTNPKFDHSCVVSVRSRGLNSRETIRHGRLGLVTLANLDRAVFRKPHPTGERSDHSVRASTQPHSPNSGIASPSKTPSLTPFHTIQSRHNHIGTTSRQLFPSASVSARNMFCLDRW